MSEFDDLSADAVAVAEQAVMNFTIENNFSFYELGFSINDSGNSEGVIE